MDAISERTATMVMFSLYSFVMQVVLLNLLIAMFSSTCESLAGSQMTDPGAFQLKHTRLSVLLFH